ncbi:MAG: hypothetical protein QGI46_05785 [Planctomycetota bacterium]|jgi:hypothetical protein|nr:hypothetical protein [Planctomycetota bacterium]
MRPYDAVFLALVASRCLDRPKRWWLVLLVPLLAYGIGCCEPPGRFALPATALLVVVLVPRWAPVGLLLAVPVYGTLVQSLGAAATWLGLDVVFNSLLARVRDDAVPPRLRGWPIRLLVAAVLYYTLLPLTWL